MRGACRITTIDMTQRWKVLFATNPFSYCGRRSSGLIRSVVGWFRLGVSKEHATLMFRVMSPWIDLKLLIRKRCVFFRNVRKKWHTPRRSPEHLNSKAVENSKHSFHDFNNVYTYFFRILSNCFIVFINCVLLMSDINARFFRPGKITII